MTGRKTSTTMAGGRQAVCPATPSMQVMTPQTWHSSLVSSQKLNDLEPIDSGPRNPVVRHGEEHSILRVGL
jgi:hypothetical protein